MKYSQDQIKAINSICNQLLDPTLYNSHVINVLTGPAGTGKTTVVAEIINQLRSRETTIHISLCATTNRAAEVLENIVNEDVTTGHILFKLRPVVTKYGKESLKK